MADGATTLPRDPGLGTPDSGAPGSGALDSAARDAGAASPGTGLGGTSAPGAGEIACPHCGATSRRDAAGAILDCAVCGRSFATPRPRAIPPSGSAAARTTFESIKARSPTDVGLRRTGALAAVLTLVFYGALVMPLSDTYFGELFGARGWVPYVIAWMSAWAGLLLVAKAAMLRAQRKALDLDLLPDDIAPRITRQNADTFQQHLRGLAGRELHPPRLFGTNAMRSFLVERGNDDDDLRLERVARRDVALRCALRHRR